MESDDLPNYLKSPTRLNKTSRSFVQTAICGKRPQKTYHPHLNNGKYLNNNFLGVSYEFPTNIKVQHELISSYSNKNPYLEITPRKNNNPGKRKLGAVSKSLNTQRIRKDNVDDHFPNTIFKLKKNADIRNCKNCLEHEKTLDKSIDNSINLRISFQDYNIFKETLSPSSKNAIKYPQKEAHLYNCVTDKFKTIRPPFLNIESYSAFKDK
jgi:hypothetical protein